MIAQRTGASAANSTTHYELEQNPAFLYTQTSLSGAGKPLFYRGLDLGPPRPGRTNEKTMPKLKTHTGAKKRFKMTGTGKIKRGQTKTRHILSSKSPKVKRKLGKSVLVSDGDYAKVARMIPYA
jgi:large subunit ribosomal protein L35